MKTLKCSFYRFFFVNGVVAFLVLSNFTNVYAQNNNQPPIATDNFGTPPPAVNHGYDTNSDINVYVHPDTMARFPGSIKKYFADSIRYPEDAKEKRIQGTVFLNVIIERDGSISNINILRTPNSILNQEAIRVVSTMPKWIPGKQNGKTVRVQKVMPIRFDLPTTSADSAMKK